MRIQVLVADHHTRMRRTIRRVLERTATIEVVGEATNDREAIELAQQSGADVLLTDLQMPEMDGLEVVYQIARLVVSTRVLVVSLFVDGSFVATALQRGATGYVAKESIVGHLVPAVESVHAGRQYLCSVAERALNL